MSRIPLKAVLRELDRRGISFAKKEISPETQKKVNDLINGMSREWNPTYQNFEKLNRAFWDIFMRMGQDSPITPNSKEGKQMIKSLNLVKDHLTFVYTLLRELESKYKR